MNQPSVPNTGVYQVSYDQFQANQLSKPKTVHNNSINIPQAESVDSMMSEERNFESLLSTLVLFIDQEPFSNVAMNLEVNFWHVCQGNFSNINNTNFLNEIFKDGGDTFSNNPIHLLFYEKEYILEELVPTLNAPPQITFMRRCKCKSDPALKLPEAAFELEQILVLQGVTSRFVSKE